MIMKRYWAMCSYACLSGVRKLLHHGHVALHVVRRGFAKTPGGDAVAVKKIQCLRYSTEKAVRCELDTMKDVTKLKLDGCMPYCGAYVQLLPSRKGVNYYITMPCATPPSPPRSLCSPHAAQCLQAREFVRSVDDDCVRQLL